MKKAILLLTMISSTSFADPIDISVTATTHPYSTAINQAMNTIAQHDIEIINNTDTIQSFSYLYQYCEERDECVKAESTVTVLAHQKWNNHHDSSLWVFDSKKSYHTIIADTIVNSATIHKQATSRSTISVG